MPYVNLEILIGQLVNLVQGRRAGADVEARRHRRHAWRTSSRCRRASTPRRYALVRSSIDSQLDIDLDLLGKRTNDNPVFYVQYAHARTRAVARNAAASGVDRSAFDPSLLAHETESAARRARGVPADRRCRPPSCASRTGSRATSRSSPGSYHRWYDNCRVIPLGDEPVEDVHRTRLWLNDATGQVLRNGLDLLGVDALRSGCRP